MPTPGAMRPPAAAVLVLALGHTCCSDRGSRVPAAPTAPTASIVTGASTAERWSLTTTYLGAVGAEACPSLGSPPVGAVQHLTMTIDRTGERLLLTVSPVMYLGKTEGHAFTATTGRGGGGPLTCGDTRIDFTDEQSVTGRFSDDGLSLAGDEVYSMWLASGATITWHTEWRATRQ